MDRKYELWAPFAKRAVDVLIKAGAAELQEKCKNTKNICGSFNITSVRRDVLIKSYVIIIYVAHMQ